MGSVLIFCFIFLFFGATMGSGLCQSKGPHLLIPFTSIYMAQNLFTFSFWAKVLFTPVSDDYVLYHHTKIPKNFWYRRRLNFKFNALKLLHLPLKFHNIHNSNFFICLMLCFQIKMCFSNCKRRGGLHKPNEAKFKWVKCQISKYR